MKIQAASRARAQRFHGTGDARPGRAARQRDPGAGGRPPAFATPISSCAIRACPCQQPAVLGHEGAGIVEKVGAAVTKVKPGDHIVMTYNSCGALPVLQGARNHLLPRVLPAQLPRLPRRRHHRAIQGRRAHRANIFGQSSFATYAICHEANAVKVPADAPLALLGPLACGIQTGAGAVMNALKVGIGDSFVVFGAGSVGLSAVMAARVVGATTIVAVDLNDMRLAVARELGATHTINPSTPMRSRKFRRSPAAARPLRSTPRAM